jgi:selenoprotein W-related protein
LTAKLLPRVKRDIARLTLIPSKGGCFELKVGNRLIHSKLATGRFPDEDEVIAAVEAALNGKR